MFVQNFNTSKMRKKEFVLRTVLKNISTIGIAMSVLLLVSCGGGDGSPRILDGETKTITESTKGVITEVEEVEPGNSYLILDEKIIDDKSQSIAIVHALNGSIDTLSLQKMQKDPEYGASHSGLRNVLMFSLAASVLTRNFGNVRPNSAHYKNGAAFNKSAGLQSDMGKSTRSRTVTSPKAGSKGYGSGKSFRSHGG
jgi:hypothetical protein